ncbi:putative tetratricopeptide-like helical domain-containing protein [Medicago truncatula]|uniref:Putative tetratricopeptide-like helical domain-containing protein n=1 Tax=Medicago truncatula TaxID=3880 RepID=A0A396IS46_MEDTR|nr:putative tetratricopeptide-like helical domain-containing protein [Medicago truncatula]
MIKLQASEDDLDGLVGLLDDMVRCGCHYSSIIGTLAGLLEDAVGIYNQMMKSDADEKKLNKHIVCTRIDIYSVMGRFKDAEMLHLKLKMSSSPNSLDVIAYSIVVRRLYFMPKKQGLVDVITYNTIIDAYGKRKDFSDMSRTVHKMQFDVFSVSLEAYNSMLDAYGKDSQMDAFRSVLKMMKESNYASDLYTYNTVINIYSEQSWIEEVSDVLAELNECGLRPDFCSYNTLIKAYGIAGVDEEAVELIKEMRKNGIELDETTYTNLINALKRNDKFLEAVKWSLWTKQIKL